MNYREQQFKIGDDGEDFIKWYCKTYNLEYIVPDKKYKYEKGVDCFINNTPTDVKNTFKIVLGNYRLENHISEWSRNKFMARMPFRENCEAIDYCILDIDPINKYNKIHYHGRIDTYLSEEFFLDTESLNKGFQIINSFDKKSYSSLNYSSINNFFYNFKEKLKPLLRENIIVDYADESLANSDYRVNELQIYLIKSNEHIILKERGIWWGTRKKNSRKAAK